MSRSRLGPVAGFMLNSHTALSERPELAARIAIIVATWAQIDHSIKTIAFDVAWADARLVGGLLKTLRSDGPQRDVIKAFAVAKLPPELSERFVGLMDRARNGAEARNDIVHGLWGLSHNHPDDLVWVSRKADLDHQSRIKPPNADYTQEELRELFDGYPEPQIYDRRRFDQIEQAALKLSHDLTALRLEVLNLRRADLPGPP
jgi:hypothetical protein